MFVRIAATLLFLLISVYCSGQQHYTDLKLKMQEYFKQKDYQRTLDYSAQLIKVFQDDFEANANYALAALYLGKPDAAKRSIEVTLELDPTYLPALVGKACLAIYYREPDLAKKLLLHTIRFGPKNPDIASSIDQLQTIGKALGRERDFAEMIEWYKASAADMEERSLSVEKLLEVFNRYTQPEELIAEVYQQADLYTNQNQHGLSLFAYSYGAKRLSEQGFPSEAIAVATKGYAQLKIKGSNEHSNIASLLIFQLVSYTNAKSDHEQAITYTADLMKYAGKSVLKVYDIEALLKISSSHTLMRSGNAEENSKNAIDIGLMALDWSRKESYIPGMAAAANAICMSGYHIENPQDRATLISYGEQAYLMADQYQLVIKDNILTNLALLYWRSGVDGQQKCMTLYRSQIDKAKKEGDFDRASLLLNNLGSMYFATNDLEKAIALFEESASLATYGPEYKNAKDRMAHYQSQLSAINWLISCYAKTNNAEKTFESMERSRARVLNERLAHEHVQTPAIADLQDLLKPDEACIMYEVFSGYELVILVVSKKYAYVTFHDDPRFVGDIRDKYFNKSKQEQESSNVAEDEARGFEWISLRQQRTQVVRGYDKEEVAPRDEFERMARLTRKFSEKPGMNDAMLEDLLTRYMRYLITPVNNRLTGVKTLFIAPNDVLSFIPFEALKMFDGKFLVEKYNIRYFHSASILLQLQAREYHASRKPLLAMGGAIYQAMEVEPMAINSDEELNVLRAEVEENITTGKSLRKAYASLFSTSAMNPLPGTTEEVKNISRNLPGSEIFVGEEMTENKIKSLSNGGKLKEYKILHLATHGFVVSEIPDLSGVAMCIYPTEQEGEDGFLNAPEIAKLQLNADLTVLSACQTALGKLYVGEGVAGLTQSLLLAGSNAALVSLWPVDDTSTMLFMSNFYKEVAKGKSYPLIVNELKRKFIKGDFGKQFTHPNFWAPFIYYGR